MNRRLLRAGRRWRSCRSARRAPAVTTTTRGDVVTMVVYDSYPDDSADEPNPLQVALDEFTADTGIEVELLKSQDAGTMLSKAVLTAGNPEGDVMWGVDNTLLSRAIEARVFDPYDVAGRGRPRPAVHRRSCPTARRRLSTTATCASTTTSPPSTRPGCSRRPRSSSWPQPEYASRLVVENAGHLVAGAGLPAGDDRQVRRRRLGAVLDPARRQRRARRRRLERGLLRVVHAGRRRSAAGRQLRLEPAVRGAVRRPSR